MIVLAVLLLALAAAVVVFVVLTGASETASLTYDPLNIAWEPSVLVVFLAGAAALFLVELALALMRGGTRRRMEQRRELKELRKKEAEQTRATDRDSGRPAARDTGRDGDRDARRETGAATTRERTAHDRPPAERERGSEGSGGGASGTGSTRSDTPTRQAPVSPPPEGDDRRG